MACVELRMVMMRAGYCALVVAGVTVLGACETRKSSPGGDARVVPAYAVYSGKLEQEKGSEKRGDADGGALTIRLSADLGGLPNPLGGAARCQMA
jgi:hypothetical protein